MDRRAERRSSGAVKSGVAGVIGRVTHEPGGYELVVGAVRAGSGAQLDDVTHSGTTATHYGVIHERVVRACYLFSVTILGYIATSIGGTAHYGGGRYGVGGTEGATPGTVLRYIARS